MRRAEAREWLVRLAYERLANPSEKSGPELLQAHDLPGDDDYLLLSLQSLLEHEEEINQWIERHLTNWSLHRLQLVDRAILQVAVNELVFTQEAPQAVTINESVELAKTYSDPQAYRFVNGVLSGVVKELAEQCKEP